MTYPAPSPYVRNLDLMLCRLDEHVANLASRLHPRESLAHWASCLDRGYGCHRLLDRVFAPAVWDWHSLDLACQCTEAGPMCQRTVVIVTRLWPGSDPRPVGLPVALGRMRGPEGLTDYANAISGLCIRAAAGHPNQLLHPSRPTTR